MIRASPVLAWWGRACSLSTALRTAIIVAPSPERCERLTRARGSPPPQRARRPRLVSVLASSGSAAELRRGLAGQLAVAVMADMLGLDADPAQLLAWYDAKVAGVSAMSVSAEAAAGERGELGRRVPPPPRRPSAS